MESKSADQGSNWSIQDYLSLGYLYLLTLGMFKNIIFYGFLGVNILSYSSVLDVLLSPFIELGRDPKIIGAFAFMIFVIYMSSSWLTKKQKGIHKTDKEKPKPNGVEVTQMESFIFFTALVVFGFFVGNGLGGGYKASQKVKEGSYKANHQLTFTDGEKLQVRLLDTNSQYVFYVIENGTQVTITPISGNIKKIEKLPKPKKEK